ncbi:Protein FAR1-RELATED SEQUENCE 5 [Glycine soja]
MDEDQWRYDFAMSQEVHMDYDYDNQEECGVNEPHVDCSNAFNTSQVFATRDNVLQWARTVAHENGFVAVIMRSDTETGSRGRSSFVLIGCERSGTYKCRNKEFVRKDTGSRKCGCPFRLRGKPVRGGEGCMVKLICGIHNHELAKSLVGHPYAGRLTKEEKKIIADMTKSMVKPKNILLTLKEHNADSYTTIKQIYNARSAYRSSIRGADTEMQHLMKLLERDQYIHWHRLKDEVVVRDLFWCHPDAVKLCNACHLVFFIDSTYKTNRYRLPLFDFVGVTPTAMTFSAGFAYLEAERVNNIVWALERFRGLFLRHDRLPLVIVTDRDLALMNAVKTVFPESTNLLCRFHIDKNVKAKCKSLIGEKNVWDYVMDSWGTLVDCPSEYEFHESHQKFQVACSPWPMFIDYVNDTWIIPHKEKFITAWTNKVMHLGNTTTNRIESAHWALKRVLQNSVGDLCSVWDAMNNMITLQHVEIKASFETSTHVVGHVYKKTLYKRLLGMVSRDALNQIASEIDRLRYLGNNLSSCGCVMRSTHGLPCACELSRYTASSIPLESVHLFWRRLCFSDQGLCETEVTIKEEIEVISKRFDELDVAGKVNLKSKLREIAYPDHNSICPPPSKVNTKGAPKKPMKRSQTSTKRDPSYWEYVDAFHSVQSSNSPVKRSASCSQPRQPTRIIPMLDQFASFFQGFIRDVVDVKADGNCGYRSIGALLGMGEDSWPLVRNELLKELGRWSHEYMNLFGGTERFEQLKLSLLVDGFSKVSMDKWMDITDMGYVIASRYNVILVSLSQQQSMTFFPLRSQPPPDSSGHRIICVGHVFGNHFVQVYLKDHCPLPPPALLWSTNCYSQAKQWAIPYISRMQQYTSLIIHNTLQLSDKQFLDEIHYRKPFTDTGNQIRFECIKLINDDDVNTMLMCNDQFSCVGPIELLCTVGRTPDEIINLLERTMSRIHDAILYYNGKWNMPPQNKFVGCAFTGKNPKKFQIPSTCTIDELKNLIKQVAPKGIPPLGIHESQTVRRLFFCQPARFEYSDTVIKYEINELITNEELLKVLVQSNYWKKYGPIEILAVFTKYVEDEVSGTSLNN